LSILAKFLIFLVALEHFYILYLEMYGTESKTAQKTFNLDLEFLKDERVKKILANQGLYNGFLASGLVWSLIEATEYQVQIAVFFIVCIICAAFYGSVTASKKIFMLQGVPAILALIALLLPLLIS